MKTIPEQELLNRIRAFLAATGMTETRFGRVAALDAKLVHGLENGRELRRETRARIEQFFAKEAERAAKVQAALDQQARPG